LWKKERPRPAYRKSHKKRKKIPLLFNSKKLEEKMPKKTFLGGEGLRVSGGDALFAGLKC